MVDLGFGLVTPSLPVLVGLMPQNSSSTYDTVEQTVNETNNTGANSRSTMQNHTALKGASYNGTGGMNMTSMYSDRHKMLIDQEAELTCLLVCHRDSKV